MPPRTGLEQTVKPQNIALFACALLLIAACGSTNSNPSGGASQSSTLVAETAAPVTVFPTPLPQSTSTPSPMPHPTNTAQPPVATVVREPIIGTWQHILTPDGPCAHTSWHLDGYEVIGADTGIICRPTAEGWSVEVVPAQHRVIDLGLILIGPPGGFYARTDTGQICHRAAYSDAGTPIPPQDQQWKCEDDLRWPTQVPKENVMSVGGGYFRFKDGIYAFIDKTTGDGGEMHYFAAETLTGVAGSQITWAEISDGGEPLHQGSWVGTGAQGLFFINSATADIQHWNQSNGLPGDAIRKIQIPHMNPKGWQNMVWVATDNGIARFDGSTWKTYQVQDGLPSNDIRDITGDGTGTAWAATAKGAAYFDGVSWMAPPTNDLVIEDLIGVAGAYDEPDTKIIFGTRDNGLFVFTLLKP